MIQRCQHLRFALKSCEPLGIVRESFGQNLDCHVAPKFGVVRLIHLAHAARADLRGDLIRTEFGPAIELQIPRFARGFRLAARTPPKRLNFVRTEFCARRNRHKSPANEESAEYSPVMELHTCQFLQVVDS